MIDIDPFNHISCLSISPCCEDEAHHPTCQAGMKWYTAVLLNFISGAHFNQLVGVTSGRHQETGPWGDWTWLSHRKIYFTCLIFFEDCGKSLRRFPVEAFAIVRIVPVDWSECNGMGREVCPASLERWWPITSMWAPRSGAPSSP